MGPFEPPKEACIYLERHELIHRDLRPCNVQICRRGQRCQVKVLDFGVTIAAERALRQGHSSAVHVFGANRTPQDGYDWLPPEVWSKGLNFEWPVHSFDIFSLGVLGLNLFLGQSGTKEVMLQVSRQVSWVEVATRWNKTIPEAVTRLLEMMLHSSAKLRPSPLEVWDALIRVYPKKQPGQRRRETMYQVKVEKPPSPAILSPCVPSVDLTPPPKEIPLEVETPPPPFKSLSGAEAALQQLASQMGDLLQGPNTPRLSRKRPSVGSSETEKAEQTLLFRMQILLKEVERCRVTCQSLQGSMPSSEEVEILS